MAGEVTLLEQSRSNPNPQAVKTINVFAMEYIVNALMTYSGNVSGFFYPWNVADTLPTVAPRDFNVEFVADFGKSSNYMVPWKNYGGVLKVDKALKLGNPGGANRQMLMQLQAIAKRWAQDIFLGTGGTSMTGLDLFLAQFFPGQIVNGTSTTANGDLLTMDMMDTAMDLISDPSAIFVSRNLRKRLTYLARTNAAGQQNVQYIVDQFGTKVPSYNKVPIYVMQDEMTSADILPSTEIDGAGSNNTTSSVRIVRFGDDGVHGFTPRPDSVITISEESRDNFDQVRLEKNAAVVQETPRSCVRIKFLKDSVT